MRAIEMLQLLLLCSFRSIVETDNHEPKTGRESSSGGAGWEDILGQTARHADTVSGMVEHVRLSSPRTDRDGQALDGLFLASNPWEYPPVEVVKQGTESVFDYLRTHGTCLYYNNHVCRVV